MKGFPGRAARFSLSPYITEVMARANLRLISYFSCLEKREGLSKRLSMSRSDRACTVPSRMLSNPLATEILPSLWLTLGKVTGE